MAFVWCAALALGAQIDPQIYAKIFEVNTPAWEYVAKHVQALPAGSKLLDVGAGPGEPTTTISRLAPHVQVTCTDSQQGMNDKAKVRAKDAKNVEFQVASIEDLSMFAPASFDAVTGIYVLMFVDVKRALEQVAAVLKPGGKAYLAVWHHVHFIADLRKVIQETWDALGGKGPAPPFPMNPMALSPVTEAAWGPKKGLLEDQLPASLVLEDIKALNYPFHFGTAEATCQATQVLTAMMPNLGSDCGTTMEAFEAEMCKRLTAFMHAHEDWKMPDGTYRFGSGTPHIYVVQKQGKPEL